MGTLRIGVSSCLLGTRCRYDGADSLLTALAAAGVDFVPVCPEVELGMPVPREPLRLVGPASDPRMVGEETGADWTSRMQAWASARVRALSSEGLHAFVLKSRSPSCGLGSTKRWPGEGGFVRDGTGLFARVLAERMPSLPIVEESALEVAGGLEAFLARARAYADG